MDLSTLTDAELAQRHVDLANEQEKIKAARRDVRDELIRRDELARAPKPAANTPAAATTEAPTDG